MVKWTLESQLNQREKYYFWLDTALIVYSAKKKILWSFWHLMLYIKFIHTVGKWHLTSGPTIYGVIYWIYALGRTGLPIYYYRDGKSDNEVKFPM